MDWGLYRGWLIDALIRGRLSSLMTVLCIVLLTYNAAHWTWMIVPAPREEAAPPAVKAPSAVSSQFDALSLGREIVARHLFGQAQAVGAGQGSAIPETQLQLVLRGVMASGDPRTATAIIADPSGNENFYRVGKELPGSAILKEVHDQHIVLSRGGRIEVLRLPEDALKGSEGVKPPPAALMPSSVAPPAAGPLVQQYRDQFLHDPQSLANALQGEPYWESGRMIGYRLRPGRDAGALMKLGLRPGDIVTAINGMSMADAAGRTELLRNIANATQFNVDMRRNGKPFSITIPVGQ